MSEQPLFHVVDRSTAEGQPELLNCVDAEDWPWAIYRRVTEPADLKYGVLMGVFWDEAEANLTCMTLNCVRDMIVTITTPWEEEEKVA